MLSTRLTASGNAEAQEVLPDGGIVRCVQAPASVIEISYSRNSMRAHNAAFDEHERLVADGWEVLGRQELTESLWVMRYVKMEKPS